MLGHQPHAIRSHRKMPEGSALPFTFDDEVVELIASRCTELERGEQMIGTILTNSVKPSKRGTEHEHGATATARTAPHAWQSAAQHSSRSAWLGAASTCGARTTAPGTAATRLRVETCPSWSGGQSGRGPAACSERVYGLLRGVERKVRQVLVCLGLKVNSDGRGGSRQRITPHVAGVPIASAFDDLR
jgi:hypothetical protein